MNSANEASPVVVRPRLETMLDRVLGHRLALVVADAGFGKTTLLTSWSSGINAVIHDVTAADDNLSRFVRNVVDALRLRIPELSHELAGAIDGGPPADTTGQQGVRPDAIAELLGSALEQHLLRDVVLVLDNAHLLTEDTSIRFLAALIRHAPPLLHLVLASRTMPPMTVDRLRDRGEVIELHGADLDFTAAEIAELLTAIVGADAVGLADRIHHATAGWPAAVRMSIEALRDIAPERRAGYIADLAGEHGRIARLATSIYRQEPAESKRLLATVAIFDEVTVELLEAIGVDAAEPMAAMVRRGLFLEPGASGSDWYRLHAIAGEAVAEQDPLPDARAVELRLAAAKWLAANGLPRPALRTLVAAGQHAQVVALLARFGQPLLSHGHAEDVLAAIAVLPDGMRDETVQRLAGEAFQLRGAWEQALACYTRAAPADGSVDPGLAWRMGLIRYLRGELEEALEIYRRGRTRERPTRDSALLLAWKASAYWMRGEVADCARVAVRAMRLATEVDDPQALASAHTVLAMLAALEGDRRANDAHYLKALQYAERAGDVLQMVRIRNNRGSRHLEEGSYLEALAELDIAIRLADLSGFAAFGALALCNRGEAKLGLGRLEEAQGDFFASIAAFDSLESGFVANPLEKLGNLYHLRGELSAAKDTFERALKRAELAGDVQAMVPALAGLARLLAEEEPARAAELAQRAIGAGGIDHVSAVLAAGWVALINSDRQSARQSALSAAATAHDRRDVPGQAEAAVLEAAATDDDAQALRLADQGVALWARTGDPIGQAFAELVRAVRLEEAAARPALEAIQERMRAIGCRLVEGKAAAALAKLAPANSSTVRVETLGGFRLVRGGQVVPSSEWKSRKARDLLKILLSRRGRPITHEQLVAILWPGESPAEVGNRFNVLVSTLRSLLDPARQRSQDGFLLNEADALRIELEALDVDVESFLADAAAGLRLVRAGREAEGIERLLRAESRYAGDFLEEDLYADWAAPLREEARVTYRQLSGCLARHARRTGNADAAIRHLLRSLERDPYDESTHLELVSVLSGSGRHGDARRHYRSYCERMDELGVEAAPFPAAF